MNKIVAILAAIAATLFLSGCLETRNERDVTEALRGLAVAEKAAEKWKKDAEEARKELAVYRELDVGAAHPASGPCFRFATTEAAAKKQASLCDAWIRAFEAKARRQATAEMERSKAARRTLLERYPGVMREYLVLAERQNDLLSFEETVEAGKAMTAFLGEHQAFASALAASEYQPPPSVALSRNMNQLRGTYEAVQAYVRATGGPRP